MKIKKIVRVILTLSLCFFFVQFLFFGSVGVIRYFEKKREIALQKEKIVRLADKIKILENEIKSFMSDDVYVQRIAREDLQMGFADEKIYLFVE